MDFRDLVVYKKAFELSMSIFELTKTFPKEERYSLTDQIRRSSRSVCPQIAEGYRKRMYEGHFISKMTDGDMENSETIVWLDFAFSCGYMTKEFQTELTQKSEEIGKLLGHMIKYPEKYRGTIEKRK
jgi:four helix bundle protein